jgi:hypothetical protein
LSGSTGVGTTVATSIGAKALADATTAAPASAETLFR